MMNAMIRAVSQHPNRTYLQLEWAHEGLVLAGSIDTIYETDNGKLEGTPSYREYYACAFRVKHVLANAGNGVYPAGSLIEICQDTAPTKITLKDGSVVWQV